MCTSWAKRNSRFQKQCPLRQGLLNQVDLVDLVDIVVSVELRDPKDQETQRIPLTPRAFYSIDLWTTYVKLVDFALQLTFGSHYH